MVEFRNIDRVLHYFKEISKIPRCSGNEKEISDYLKKFGEEKGFPVYQDRNDNIIITKPGTKGYENSPTVTLQGHMDMVCIKEEKSKHDFKKDGIELIEKEGSITGNKTTLGADNGVALAIALAILERDDIRHPELEVLFTTGEETDMRGVLGLSKWVLKGNRLINLDTDREGVLIAGSAGGASVKASYEKVYENCPWEAFNIKFQGLKGGHSGTDINKNRGNIIKVMAHFFDELFKKVNFRIGKINSGTQDNAIPNVGEVDLCLEYGSEDLLKLIKGETLEYFEDLDGELSIEIEKTQLDRTWNKSTSYDVINALIETQSGVNSFIGDTNIVESSSNLAIINETEDKINIEVSFRSSRDSKLNLLLKSATDKLKKRNFSYTTLGEYPAWEYKEESELRKLAKEVYKNMFGKEMETLVIHAGLECGTIVDKYPKMDTISIGPNIYEIHTTKEKMDLGSLSRFYDYTLELLKVME